MLLSRSPSKSEYVTLAETPDASGNLNQKMVDWALRESRGGAGMSGTPGQKSCIVAGLKNDLFVGDVVMCACVCVCVLGWW